VIIGGTAGIGRAVAEAMARAGERVVITGRTADRARAIAAGIGANVTGLALDLAEPRQIATALQSMGPVRKLVIAAIERDNNSIRDFDVTRALRLLTLKLVGYAEVVHVLAPRMGPDAAIVLLGGQAKERPYPGSTTVSTVNGGIVGLVRTMAVELAPIRVNGLHPGIVADTASWAGKPAAFLEGRAAATPAGRLTTTADVVGAVQFLLDNRAVNGVDLALDGGALLR
jgi:NAD(P)-dependent dehydrogenase (short-subunit alcohol dehydrogenase family)